MSLTEYTHWELIYYINVAIQDFVTAIENTSDYDINVQQQVTHIYYATTIQLETENNCKYLSASTMDLVYPRTCNYVLIEHSGGTDFQVSISMNQTSSIITFIMNYLTTKWMGIGIYFLQTSTPTNQPTPGPTSSPTNHPTASQGYAMIWNGNNNDVGEYSIDQAHSDPVQTRPINSSLQQFAINNLTTEYKDLQSGGPGAVEFSRAYNSDNGPVFYDSTELINIYAAHGTAVTIGTHTDYMQAVDILIVPDNTGNTKWCTGGINGITDDISACYIAIDITGAPTGEPTVDPTPVPTVTPTRSPTSTPKPTKVPTTAEPTTALPTTAQPTAPSASPSTAPSTSPSLAPSTSPSSTPSTAPSTSPSIAPSSTPSSPPSTAPSRSPSLTPSTAPSTSPSSVPSNAPSSTPTAAPSTSPSKDPSAAPSIAPSLAPSTSPSKDPTDAPSRAPSLAPTNNPTTDPTLDPTFSPTPKPTRKPTQRPTVRQGENEVEPPTTSKPTNNPTATPETETPINLQLILYVLAGVGGFGVIMIIVALIQFYQDGKVKNRRSRGGVGPDLDDDGRADADADVDGFLLFERDQKEDKEEEEEEEEEEKKENTVNIDMDTNKTKSTPKRTKPRFHRVQMAEVRRMQRTVNNDDFDDGGSDLDNL